jgi:DNA topoisomerase-1
MTYTLLIVESPAKCKKIEGYLGSGYKCMASFGHITELTGLKSIDVNNNFKPTYSLMESKKQQISKLRNAIKQSNEVLLASDDDREGEAIAWHICQVFNLPVTSTKRIIFNEITKSALQKSVKNPKIINMDIVYAQQARQILDIMVGFKISPILWNKVSGKTGLSAGRCQSPALRLIYDNHKEINESSGNKNYVTTGIFTGQNIPFVLNHNHSDKKTIEDFLESTVNHDHVYNYSEPKNTIKKQSTPFTTSTLQQSASNDFKMSPKMTMSACQTLYEGGFITYMRTDSITYSIDFIESVKKFILSEYSPEFIRTDIDSLSLRICGDKNVQEAHESIRPTDVLLKEVDIEMGVNERRLYKLIWRNTVESCMPDARFSVLKASVSAPDEHSYRYSAEQVVFPGWMVVNGYEKISSIYAYLQSLKNEIVVPYNNITAKLTLQNLKSHYTESRLVHLLEKNGIGRPSTFSSLVDKIQERKYVKKTNVKGKKIKCIDYELLEDEILEHEVERVFGNENNKLVIEPLGIIVIEFLIDNFNKLFDYDYTKTMENSLDQIAEGDKLWYHLCKECLDEIDTLSSHISDDKHNIRVDEKHTYLIGKYGPVIKCVDNEKTTFKKVNPDIDFDKLRDGIYTLDEILQKPQTGRKLGIFHHKNVILKSGKYGAYFEYDNTNISASSVKKEFDDITIDDFKNISNVKKKVVIRQINDNISIRSGKYGDYIFYKTQKMSKPKFLKLTDFIKENGANSHKKCDINKLSEWINETYDI